MRLFYCRSLVWNILLKFILVIFQVEHKKLKPTSNQLNNGVEFPSYRRNKKSPLLNDFFLFKGF